MHELAVEETVWGCVGVGGVEAPAGLAFGVGTHDRDREERFQVLDVADEVGTVGKGTKEAWRRVSLGGCTGIGKKGYRCIDDIYLFQVEIVLLL